MGLLLALLTTPLPASPVPKIMGLPTLLACLYFAFVYFAPGFLKSAMHPAAAQSAALTVGCAFAFGLGLLRIAPPRWLFFAGLLLSLAGGVADLLALWPDRDLLDVIASCFSNRHAFAGFMLVALFVCLISIERATGAKTTGRPPLWLFAAGILSLFALLLSDSRSAQGTFFLLLFPTLFLSLRLDFKEPHPERLAWVAATALGAGLIWINLPERQLHAAAHVFTENPLNELQQREAAWGAFSQSPWFGQGAGSYPWAARAMLPTLTSGDKGQTGIDSLWHELEWGFDQAQDQADLALTTAPLPSAASHPLQMLAEIGFVGYGLELTLLGLALFTLFRESLRFGTPSARFLGIALLGLSLHGLFTPSLEEPLMRIIYFGLIGYGASYAQSSHHFDRIFTSPWIRWVLRAALLVITAHVLWWVTLRWQAQRLFTATLAAAEDPRTFTDGMVAVLRKNPYHIEASYAYAQILVRFGRKDQALATIANVVRIAPDPPRQDLARASIHLLSGSPQEATRLLTPWIHRFHPPLPALEMAAEIYAATNQCEPLGRMLSDSARYRKAYPKPSPERYTVSRLQVEFMRGEEVNFLQRWFGGEGLRKRFASRRLAEYHRALEMHQRLNDVMQLGCDPGEIPQSGKVKKRRLWQIPKG